MSLSTLVTNPELELASYYLEGYKCTIIHNGMGYRCGYIRVSKDHPWYGLSYNEVDGNVHGGLTFSEAAVACSENPTGEGWWLGFDCAHSGDAPDPELPFGNEASINLGMLNWGTVKTEDYVRSEIAELVSQAKLAMNHNLNISNLSAAEVATILAALRCLQANRDDINLLELSHFDSVQCLSDEEIDELCEKINLG